MKAFNHRSVRGTTLIETVIAACFIATIAVTIAVIVPRAMKAHIDSDQRLFAKTMSEEFFQYLRAHPTTIHPSLIYWVTVTDERCADPIPVFGGYGYDKLYFPPVTVVHNGISYTRYACIDHGDINQWGQFQFSPPDEAPKPLLRVILAIRWQAKDSQIPSEFDTRTLIDRNKVANQIGEGQVEFDLCKASPSDPTVCGSNSSDVEGSSVVLVNRYTSEPQALAIAHYDPGPNKAIAIFDNLPQADYQAFILQNGYFPRYEYPVVVRPGKLNPIHPIVLKSWADYSSRAVAEVFISSHPLMIAQVACQTSNDTEYLVLNNPNQSDVLFSNVRVTYYDRNGNATGLASLSPQIPPLAHIQPGGFFQIKGSVDGTGVDVHYPVFPAVENAIDCQAGAIKVETWNGAVWDTSDLVGWGNLFATHPELCQTACAAQMTADSGPNTFQALVRYHRRGEQNVWPQVQPNTPDTTGWASNYTTYNNANDLGIWQGSAANFGPFSSATPPTSFRTGAPAVGAVIQINDPVSSTATARLVNAGTPLATALVEIPQTVGPEADGAGYAHQAIAVLDDYQLNTGAGLDINYKPLGRADPTDSSSLAWGLLGLIGGTFEQSYPPLPCVSPGPCDTNSNATQEAIPDPANRPGISADFINPQYRYSYPNPPGMLPDAKTPYITMEKTGCYVVLRGSVTHMNADNSAPEPGPNPGVSVAVSDGQSPARFSNIEKLTAADGYFYVIVPVNDSFYLIVNPNRAFAWFYNPLYTPITVAIPPMACHEYGLSNPLTLSIPPLQRLPLNAVSMGYQNNSIQGMVQSTPEEGNGTPVPLKGITIQGYNNGLFQNETQSMSHIDYPAYPDGTYVLGGVIFPLEVRVAQNRTWVTVTPSSGAYAFNGTPSSVVNANFTVRGIPGEIGGTAPAGTLVLASTFTLNNIPTLSGHSQPTISSVVVGEEGTSPLQLGAGFPYFLYCIPRGSTSSTLLQAPLNTAVVLPQSSDKTFSCPP